MQGIAYAKWKRRVVFGQGRVTLGLCGLHYKCEDADKSLAWPRAIVFEWLLAQKRRFSTSSMNEWVIVPRESKSGWTGPRGRRLSGVQPLESLQVGSPKQHDYRSLDKHADV